MGLIIAEFRAVRRPRALDMNEPMLRFRMHVDFRHRPARNFPGVDSDHEMTMDRARVVASLLFAREVPMGIKPMGITRGEHEFPGSV